ncbi:MAG: hypothetical protein C0418_03180 [Coriobacteriaceae bacterium]|nr:hypothetical protein [Coriobacteriaceae bacterium]
MNDLPGWFLYLAIPVVLLQLTLQVWGIVDLLKRDNGPFKGMKLIWFLVILLGGLIGVVLYLAVGRGMVGTAPAVEQGAAPSTDRAKAAVESLYGEDPADAGR